MRNIRQNLFLAFVYNAVGVPVRGWSALSDPGAGQPDLGERGDDAQLGVGHCECAATEARSTAGESGRAQTPAPQQTAHETASSGMNGFSMNATHPASAAPPLSEGWTDALNAMTGI